MNRKRKILAIFLTVVLIFAGIPIDYVDAAETNSNSKTPIAQTKDNTDSIQISKDEATPNKTTDATPDKTTDKTTAVADNKTGITTPEQVAQTQEKKASKTTRSYNYTEEIYGMYYRITDDDQLRIYWSEYNYDSDATYTLEIYDSHYDFYKTFDLTVPHVNINLPMGTYTAKLTAKSYDDSLGPISDTKKITVNYHDDLLYLLSAQATSTTSIKLSWLNPTDSFDMNHIDGYEIWKYNRQNKEYFFRAAVGPYTEQFVDRGLYKNNTYTYKIRPYELFNGQRHYGTFSPIAYDKIGVSTPHFISATSYTTSVSLRWSSQYDADGYLLYRSTSKYGTYQKIATLRGSDNVYYTSKKLQQGKTYYYKVRAYRYLGGVLCHSNYSKVLTRTTIAHARPNLKALTVDEDDLDSWITNYYGIVIRNDTGYTMTIQTSAFLVDADYPSYNRNLRVHSWKKDQYDSIHKASIVKIPPHSIRGIMFYTSNASWYDNNSCIICKFKLDGLMYKLRVGYNYGWRWWKA